MIVLSMRLSRRGMGVLNAVAGGVLAYLALEIGAATEEVVEKYASAGRLDMFLWATLVTTVAMGGTWLALAKAEERSRSLNGNRFGPGSIASIIAVALGLHNVGEGFAIAAALLQGALGLAMLFTIGFALHNLTEGFAIAGPMIGSGRLDRDSLIRLIYLSLATGLPVIPGAAIYYIGLTHEMFMAALYSVAEASIVFALLHVNLSAMSKLGGLTSTFWGSLLLGVALAFGTESIMLLSGAAV